MAASTEFVQLDVEGDGNCFYRAVYGAAKYHPYGILERLLMCLDLPADLDEDDFCSAIRGRLVAEITGDLFERIKAAEGTNLYETLREAAQLAADGEPLLWEAALAEASDEFQERFADADDFLRLSLDDFKSGFAEIIANSGVYASEMDYKILEFLLAQCGIDLLSVNPAHNERPPLMVERNGRPVLLVRRLLNLEHYSYLLPKEVYEEHKSDLSKWRKNRKIYRVTDIATNVKEARTRKSPKSVATKSVTIRKTRKSKATASNNNANLAAAIAASMANTSNRRSRL